jgi:DNA end-binding protein Ku
MAVRLAWKGVLKLSLITISIRVFPATNPASDVSFRQLHRKCHTPIQMKNWCPHCNIELDNAEIVKGCESSKGHYVLVENEEIAGLRPEASHVVEISHLAESTAIDPIYIERTYYLAPDNKTAGSAFAVIREGLNGSAGIGRLALHGREYLVAVVPRDSALLAYTLRTAGEVRNMADIEELKYGDVKPKTEEVKLARQVLHSFEPVADLSKLTDNYQNGRPT